MKTWRMVITQTIMNSHGSNRHSSATIDLNAIRHNYKFLKETAGGNRLIAVVKADAYGHGAREVAKALPDADAFAVAALGEALSLREAGVTQKILVMGGFIDAHELEICIEHNIDPVIHHHEHLKHINESSDLKQLDIWVKVDSGMGRLGYALEDVTEVLASLNKKPSLGKVRMMTHLASADERDNSFTQKQLDNVEALKLEEYEWGISNSAGVLGWPDSHRLWVRSGIAMYGADPMSDRNTANRDLRPAMTLKTKILAINSHKAGDVIGYANSYSCPGDMTIAVVACGYADGYPRLKTSTASVLIKGQRCNIVGRVSMDMITIDVTAIHDLELADPVIMFGDNPTANHCADCADTIAYEILCNVGGHVRREYIG